MPEHITLTVGTARISALTQTGSTSGLPLLVCVPGGSYTSGYFDVPGHSLFTAAAERGFPIVALDRPGYGGSDPLTEVSFASNAEVLTDTIADLWTQQDEHCPGVVLVGHSMGGAIAVHIAAGPRTWPLLGISINAIHVVPPQAVTDAWQAIPRGTSIEFTSEDRARFMYGPEGTHDPAVLKAAEPACAPIPVDELYEVIEGWPRDFARLAPAVNVPVHYGLAEHEGLWNSTPESIAAFAAAFAAAPQVTAHTINNSGHNVDHHYAGRAFHSEQLDWAAGLSRS
ncbi:alpha/beta hydrolase [Streptomyces sp. NPDC048473]|uniref:alpha/beta hydrolase n=1 Tax=unclassified Streptomyces TaxID=2593676 RepID=UPI00371F0A49